MIIDPGDLAFAHLCHHADPDGLARIGALNGMPDAGRVRLFAAAWREAPGRLPGRGVLPCRFAGDPGWWPAALAAGGLPCAWQRRPGYCKRAIVCGPTGTVVS